MMVLHYITVHYGTLRYITVSASLLAHLASLILVLLKENVKELRQAFNCFMRFNVNLKHI